MKSSFLRGKAAMVEGTTIAAWFAIIREVYETIIRNKIATIMTQYLCQIIICNFNRNSMSLYNKLLVLKINFCN